MLHNGCPWIQGFSLLLLLYVSGVSAQVTLPSPTTVANVTSTTQVTPLPCVNGVFNGRECECVAGWTGSLCDTCKNSRLKLTQETGLLLDGSENYQSHTKCLYYIEANSSARSINLRVRWFNTECQWDALTAFKGDSVFHPKIAAYSGDLLELPPESNTSLAHYREPREITLTATGSQMLLYFYSDAGEQRPGFEIAYWVDNACPDNCSSRGVCDGNGTCLCESGWTGRFCELTVCPNNCSSNGLCLDNLCACSSDYSGYDCSLSVSSPHWERVSTAPLPDSLTLPMLARASHSAISLEDHLIIYGGYQFPVHNIHFRTEANSSTVEPVTVLKYQFSSKSWELINTEAMSNTTGLPRARYGHSAVLFNESMYVYGGALIPGEEITSELWALDLSTYSWRLLPGNPLLNDSSVESLPLPVRSHTAHVVGSRMVVLFGLSSGRSIFLNYIQEYDLMSGEWSLPLVKGPVLDGWMGHSSVYDRQSGLIIVHGGARTGQRPYPTHILSFDPATYTWAILSESGPQRYLHSSVLIGPLFVFFGGCETDIDDRDCHQNDTHVFNTLCGEWSELSLEGLPGNSSRYGHISVVDPLDSSLLVFGGFLGTFHHDILRLSMGNCSVYSEASACVNSSALCAWSESTGCVSASSAGPDFTFHCQVDNCLSVADCASCVEQSGCLWDSRLSSCHSNSTAINGLSSECPIPPSQCGLFSADCAACVNHDCVYSSPPGTAAHCASPNDTDVVSSSCPAYSECYTRPDCVSCGQDSRCLWCDSLSQCVPSYPLTYIYSQCLDWVGLGASNCPVECSVYQECSACQQDSRCGWCNDPSDTGLGSCLDGGFTSPRHNSSCAQSTEQLETWHFEQCPACQCNGHSTCVNSSLCEECRDNTAGGNCEQCTDGYFGDARNGGNCSVCECNGYNPVCDVGDGTCTCLAFYVTGDHCESCEATSAGAPENFCYQELGTGFIYSFSVTESREVEGFFVVTPPEDKNLHFRIEVRSSPIDQPLTLQLFLGRVSENLWVLANLTQPILLNNTDVYDVNYEAFLSNSNSSFADLFSFTHPSIRNSSNFTQLLVNNSENEYTSFMWDGDVSLVIYLSNLHSPSNFRLTVDQQDLVFLLYFFATFTICFSILLLVFLAGWYIKRKIDYRRFVRQQYIELQRRVARPFARIRTALEPVTPPTGLPPAQSPAYVAVETCRSGRAAVLSLFVRLPGEHKTGHPSPGRSGLAVGSTLVSVNPNTKKPKGNKSKKKEERSQRNVGPPGGRIRLRDVSSLTTST